MDKDTATLLREIKDASGWGETRIAEELGTTQPTVNRILNGQPNCLGSTLRAIETLHQAICAPPPAKKPKTASRSR